MKEDRKKPPRGYDPISLLNDWYSICLPDGSFVKGTFQEVVTICWQHRDYVMGITKEKEWQHMGNDIPF